MFTSTNNAYIRFTLLLFILFIGASNGADKVWSPTTLLPNSNNTADFNVPENWNPTGVPTAEDSVTFLDTNISSTANSPIVISSLRIGSPINVTFVSSLSVSGTIRVTDYRAILLVNGALSTTDLELDDGTLTSLTSFNANGTFRWGGGTVSVLGTRANINNFILTGLSGFLNGDILITNYGKFEDAARYFGSVSIVIAQGATLLLSLTDNANLMQFTPTLDGTITNNGNINVSFTLSDTSSTIRFGVTPPVDGVFLGYASISLINNGNIFMAGSGMLEVSNFRQTAGSLVLSGYLANQLGLRTNPNSITNIDGGIISGNGIIDSDVVMAPGTALYLAVSSNFTVTKISLAGNALIQTTFFDAGLHGILLTSSFNARTGTGGILRIVFGNGPNAQIIAGAGFTTLLTRDVRVRRFETILLIAPIQFTTPLPFLNLLDVEVENDRFTLTQTPVRLSTSAAVIFFNATRVDCDKQCSNAGVCVYASVDGDAHCECDSSDETLNGACRIKSYRFIAWIIAPCIFVILISFELLFCASERRNRRMLKEDPTRVTFVRPEISAYRAVHRNDAWRKMFFDFATLFLFTTEYEGSARTFDILSKITLTSATVAVGLLAIIPFGGLSSTLQPIFTGINAGLTFTLAAVQVGWASMKPRKVEFDIEVDDKKVNMWAPFNNETVGWILLALPVEMNRLYAPPTPYTSKDFQFQDSSMDETQPIRLYWANFYRLPKVLCTRVISTNTNANLPPPAPFNPPPTPFMINPITNAAINPSVHYGGNPNP